MIDGVKFILTAVNDGNPMDILHKRLLMKDLTQVVPFGTVLTLPATGSEMNSGAVNTINETQKIIVWRQCVVSEIFHLRPDRD